MTKDDKLALNYSVRVLLAGGYKAPEIIKQLSGSFKPATIKKYIKAYKSRGGSREGAGRKPGEPTKVMRIPLSKVDSVLYVIGKKF